MGVLDFFKKRKKERTYLETIKKQKKGINDLEKRHKEKDRIFSEMISDGLRHGSTIAAKHMNDKKLYKRNPKKYFEDK